MDDVERFNVPPFMCIVEESMDKTQADVSIGMITVCPSTGDVVWDRFDGTPLDLDTSVAHSDLSCLSIRFRHAPGVRSLFLLETTMTEFNAFDRHVSSIPDLLNC